MLIMDVLMFIREGPKLSEASGASALTAVLDSLKLVARKKGKKIRRLNGEQVVISIRYVNDCREEKSRKVICEIYIGNSNTNSLDQCSAEHHLSKRSH